MHQFGIAHEQQLAPKFRWEMEYCGDKYEGEYHNNRLEGYGTYTISNGTIYVGNLMDGMFHGEGTLHFTNGSKFQAIWDKGHPKEGKIIFSDGLIYEENTHYCDEFDRRFYTEILEGLKPAGRSKIVDKEPAKKIPMGCYDTGDGFYDPNTRVITGYDDPDEHNWIISKCRKAWDEYVGPKHDEQIPKGSKAY